MPWSNILLINNLFLVIKCTFRGEEATCWTTTETHYDSFKKRNETRTVTHKGQNTFVTIDVILSNEGQLPHGQYEYPFSIRLPPNLAGSFQGPYGTIKYFFVFIVDKGIRSNYMCEVPLTVISPVDFNKIRDELQLVRDCNDYYLYRQLTIYEGYPEIALRFDL
uniref:Arrestin domain-containing protein 1-like n=1 Tax=Diabrotica virgifera virgifera TaxID=50390 RepID=A0A6P7HFX5_DIAVI